LVAAWVGGGADEEEEDDDENEDARDFSFEEDEACLSTFLYSPHAET
jgi:hypothetical protein